MRDLISGKGDSFANGPADFWVRQIQNNGPIQDTYDNLAAQSGDKFLGMPFLCLSCHNGLGHLDTINVYLKTKLAKAFDATIFCDFPQTKPTSANEANAKKSVKTMLEDEQRNHWK